MEDVELEHRLTKIEAAQQAAAQTLVQQHGSLMLAVGEVKAEVSGVKFDVRLQNGRVSKLESWRTQVTAIYGAILVAAPFVFYALLRWFGG